MGNFHDSDARADVIQGFFTEVLIGEGQLAFVFGSVDDIDGFDRLIQFQARRYLARTRVRTVVDNLLERAVSILRAAGDVEVCRLGDREFFSLRTAAGRPVGDRDSWLKQAVALARLVPKLAAHGDERAPAVFSRDALEQVIRILLTVYDEPAGLSDLDAFFSRLLTGWRPSFLGLGSEVDPPDEALTPEDEVLATDLAEQYAKALTPEERKILVFKYANLPDRQLAAHLNISRQTLSPRKQELFTRLKDDLSEVPHEARVLVLERLASILTASDSEL